MSIVNIYLATTDAARQGELENHYLQQLPGSEQERYKNLHPKRQIEWLHARALLHIALQTHYSLNNGLQHVQRHEKGGLYFPGKEINLSISHTGKSVGVALVDKQAAIGLDLEALRARKLIDSTEKVFTPAENSWLDSQPSEKRLTAFYQLWTIKEACIKACRQSVWRDIGSLSFNLPQMGTFTSPNPVFHGDWQLAWGTPLADVQLALAFKSTFKINKLQLFHIDIMDPEPSPSLNCLSATQFYCAPHA